MFLSTEEQKAAINPIGGERPLCHPPNAVPLSQRTSFGSLSAHQVFPVLDTVDVFNDDGVVCVCNLISRAAENIGE